MGMHTPLKMLTECTIHFDVISKRSVISEKLTVIGTDAVCHAYKKQEVPTIGYVRSERLGKLF